MTLRPSNALATVCLLAAMATPRTAGSAILQQPDGGPTRGNRCGAGKDLVVQALERLRADSPRDELERADELLKRAADLCSEIGEAWYYRALVEAKLGNSTRADYAMRQAKMLPSEAFNYGINPFVLATPTSRGVGNRIATNTPPGASVPTVQGPPRKWALVIGVGHFNDPSIHRLNYTIRDATDLATELKDPTIGRFPAENVHLLTDAQATTKNIKSELNWIARQASPNDLVLIYVATHGSPRTLDSVGGVNYLVTYDTEMYRAGAFDEDGMYATAFPMVDLANAVATRMKALKTVILLDTCYSGGVSGTKSAASPPAPRDATPSTDMLKQMSQGSGRIIMTASGVDEESHESSTLGHGYFTYYLLKALKDSKPNTPLTEIYTSVSKAVGQMASSVGVKQHPVLYQSSDTADFPIAAPLTGSL